MIRFEEFYALVERVIHDEMIDKRINGSENHTLRKDIYSTISTILPYNSIFKDPKVSQLNRNFISTEDSEEIRRNIILSVYTIDEAIIENFSNLIMPIIMNGRTAWVCFPETFENSISDKMDNDRLSSWDNMAIIISSLFQHIYHKRSYCKGGYDTRIIEIAPLIIWTQLAILKYGIDHTAEKMHNICNGTACQLVDKNLVYDSINKLYVRQDDPSIYRRVTNREEFTNFVEHVYSYLGNMFGDPYDENALTSIKYMLDCDLILRKYNVSGTINYIS